LTLLRRYDTADSEDLEFERLWLPLKGIKKLCQQIVIPNSYNNNTQNLGVIDFKVEYLREFEAYRYKKRL
jgi:hypothetical protein